MGLGACVLITSTINHLTMAKARGEQLWIFRVFICFAQSQQLMQKLTIGQYDTESSIFDSFHFSGVSLKSDENMLPPDLRGYAPQITGVAQTNAKVTVSQNNRIIYQENVPPPICYY
ncbi:fimbria/pilus outer membrane usher protein [Escherichia coli]|nr:fimbria/pilus outer membrane usher protein [Escherichia coli]